MVDSEDHVKLIEQIIYENDYKIVLGDKRLKLCVDVDVSSKFFFGMVHFGVQRSSIRSTAQLVSVIESIRRSKFLELSGIMAYEAQLSIPDRNPASGFLMNTVFRFLKRISWNDVTQKRKLIKNLVESINIPLDFINGGGTATVLYTV
eukprot:TRINITY_DN6146_c0_g2_i6.p1 TRINITY_DN6146_c0_g2~~TRINITY_DN6146_c0_g2_i6.p1  ORF type:complete len:148 (-),score=18.26 TRINITY_DN6146_c0_g2_i6:305-748(-)